ncbi:unnamed protein product, partial [Choristocarpus tenellus]
MSPPKESVLVQGPAVVRALEDVLNRDFGVEGQYAGELVWLRERLTVVHQAARKSQGVDHELEANTASARGLRAMDVRSDMASIPLGKENSKPSPRNVGVKPGQNKRVEPSTLGLLQLRRLLRAIGEPTVGLKPVLIARLGEAVSNGLVHSYVEKMKAVSSNSFKCVVELRKAKAALSLAESLILTTEKIDEKPEVSEIAVKVTSMINRKDEKAGVPEVAVKDQATSLKESGGSDQGEDGNQERTVKLGSSRGLQRKLSKHEMDGMVANARIAARRSNSPERKAPVDVTPRTKNALLRKEMEERLAREKTVATPVPVTVPEDVDNTTITTGNVPAPPAVAVPKKVDTVVSDKTVPAPPDVTTPKQNDHDVNGDVVTPVIVPDHVTSTTVEEVATVTTVVVESSPEIVKAPKETAAELVPVNVPASPLATAPKAPSISSTAAGSVVGDAVAVASLQSNRGKDVPECDEVEAQQEKKSSSFSVPVAPTPEPPAHSAPAAPVVTAKTPATAQTSPLVPAEKPSTLPSAQGIQRSVSAQIDGVNKKGLGRPSPLSAVASSGGGAIGSGSHTPLRFGSGSAQTSSRFGGPMRSFPNKIGTAGLTAAFSPRSKAHLNGNVPKADSPLKQAANLAFSRMNTADEQDASTGSKKVFDFWKNKETTAKSPLPKGAPSSGAGGGSGPRPSPQGLFREQSRKNMVDKFDEPSPSPSATSATTTAVDVLSVAPQAQATSGGESRNQSTRSVVTPQQQAQGKGGKSDEAVGKREQQAQQVKAKVVAAAKRAEEAKVKTARVKADALEAETKATEAMNKALAAKAAEKAAAADAVRRDEQANMEAEARERAFKASADRAKREAAMAEAEAKKVREKVALTAEESSKREKETAVRKASAEAKKAAEAARQAEEARKAEARKVTEAKRRAALEAKREEELRIKEEAKRARAEAARAKKEESKREAEAAKTAAAEEKVKKARAAAAKAEARIEEVQFAQHHSKKAGGGGGGLSQKTTQAPPMPPRPAPDSKAIKPPTPPRPSQQTMPPPTPPRVGSGRPTGSPPKMPARPPLSSVTVSAESEASSARNLALENKKKEIVARFENMRKNAAPANSVPATHTTSAPTPKDTTKSKPTKASKTPKAVEMNVPSPAKKTPGPSGKGGG